MIDYRVRPADGGGSAVVLQIGYSLTGLLGQLGRPALIEAVARGLIAKFADNLERQLSDAPPERPRHLRAETRRRRTAMGDAARKGISVSDCAEGFVSETRPTQCRLYPLLLCASQ